MNILSNPLAVVYIVAVSWLFFVTLPFNISKMQEAIGRKDLATVNRARSRRLCWAHARPAIAAWQSLRHAHRQVFPQNLRQAGAVGRDLNSRAPRRAGGRQAHHGGQQKKASSSNDGGGDGDGEPPHHLEPLLNYEDFGLVARLAPDTVKNLYCRSPELLPPAIHIPGHRGPLWRPNDVSRWFEEHVTTPATVTPAPKRKAGRPRIAQAGKVGAQ